MLDVVRTRPIALLLFVLAVAEALLVDGSALSAVAVVLAAAAAGVLAVGRLAPAVPPTRVRTAIRDREQRTAFLPQRDPDASGRRRPRAPGRPLPTTA
ncbi:DUF6412 domain-containing protein [Streptomyces sp. NPDC048629]|uniref:DUF6412 domain-containing protein n=1 Tax=Streptomyces sp. NPDC048629 TaxID=3154824 RepID=UPI0034423EA0